GGDDWSLPTTAAFDRDADRGRATGRVVHQHVGRIRMDVVQLSSRTTAAFPMCDAKFIDPRLRDVDRAVGIGNAAAVDELANAMSADVQAEPVVRVEPEHVPSGRQLDKSSDLDGEVVVIDVRLQRRIGNSAFEVTLPARAPEVENGLDTE